MNVLDLFSGISGFSLGLEWAGRHGARTKYFETVAFCEQDIKCRKLLKKLWPDKKIYIDVETLTYERLKRDGIPAIDVITGGFPCQDISLAGPRRGINAARSGLWREFARLIGEIRPRYAIIENVSALRSKGLEKVLCDLAAIGYDAEWHCIPASAIGAYHQRDRIWIISNSNSKRCEELWWTGTKNKTFFDPIECLGFWQTKPPVCGVAHGFPGRVDRLKQLGNSIVPQIAEMIGKVIMEMENGKTYRIDK